jgi:prepilin-type N-terminal cleavage/methylation domain-containing protein
MLSKFIVYEYERLARRNSKSAFTLIELLVVISIISMLSSIVLAALSSARQNAKNAKFVEELHSLKTAMSLYYSYNQTYPFLPGLPNGGLAHMGTTPTFTTLLGTSLQPYLATLPDGLSIANNTTLLYMYGTDLPQTDVSPGGFHCGSPSAPIVKDYIIFFNYATGGGGTLNANVVYRNLGYGIVAQAYYCIGE